jgi:hypothetical protein
MAEEALILPCLGRSDKDMTGISEQFVSCENSTGVVQSSKGVLEPVSKDLLSEPEIVCRLAMSALGSKSKVNWNKYTEHYDNIRNDIEQTIPGFENYNERIRKSGGFYLPHCNRENRFDTPAKKAMFNISNYKDPEVER